MAAGSAVVYTGLINPAADAPHSRPVYWLMDSLRHEGIESRAQGILVPDLQDPDLIRSGAGNYDAMCADCHLKPGVTDSELHRGLYPRPPVLAAVARSTPPAKAFWIITHGIKASGMPAWGRSMDEKALWGLVAFLQQMPALTADAYRKAVELSDGHSHGGGDTHPGATNERPATPAASVESEANGHEHDEHDHSEK